MLREMSDVSNRVREFLVQEGNWQGPAQDLTDELPLIESHVVDSMVLLRLVAWLESEFGVTIADTEVVPSHFGSIAAISDLVAAKQAAAAGR